jgi:hypothetical protein
LKRACRGGASTKKPRGKLSVLTDPASPAGVTGCGRISSSDAPASKKYTPLDRNPTETNSSALRLTEWACWPAPGGLVSQLSLSVSAVWTCQGPASPATCQVTKLSPASAGLFRWAGPACGASGPAHPQQWGASWDARRDPSKSQTGLAIAWGSQPPPSGGAPAELLGRSSVGALGPLPLTLLSAASASAWKPVALLLQPTYRSRAIRPWSSST